MVDLVPKDRTETFLVKHFWCDRRADRLHVCREEAGRFKQITVLRRVASGGMKF